MALQCQGAQEICLQSEALSLWALIRTDARRLIFFLNKREQPVLTLYSTSKLAAAYRRTFAADLPIVSKQATPDLLAGWAEWMQSKGAVEAHIIISEPDKGGGYLCQRMPITDLLANVAGE